MNEDEALSPHKHHRHKKVVIFRAADNQYHWREVASNGKIVDNSGEGFVGGMQKATDRAIKALDLRDGDYTIVPGHDDAGHPLNTITITRSVD